MYMPLDGEALCPLRAIRLHHSINVDAFTESIGWTSRIESFQPYRNQLIEAGDTHLATRCRA